jgi:hypothetical protein
MERIEIEVYSQATNQAIVRMPNRKFPGCVIQGDSLSVPAWTKRELKIMRDVLGSGLQMFRRSVKEPVESNDNI